MTIEVDPRTGRVRVEVAGKLDADELLDLLKALSAARAQIARDPPRPGDVWVAPKAAVHTQLMGDAGPDSLLALQFPGIGWIGATLAPAVRAQLIGLLATQQATVVSAPAKAAAAPPAPAVAIGPERDGNSTLH